MIDGKTTDPLLLKTEQAVQARVQPQYRDAVQRIVLAGTKVMYAPQTRNMLKQQLDQQGDVASVAGQGIAKLMGLLIAKSKGTMLTKQTMPAIMPAAIILLCEGLDFLEKMGNVQIDQNTLARATQEMGTTLLQVLGLTPQKIAELRSKQSAPKQPITPTQAPGIIQSAMGRAQ